MVGIVIVCHSDILARQVRETALQMCQGSRLVIGVAGGLTDGTFGVSFERIDKALTAAMSDDGVLVLMDLGSAVMTTQMVVETMAAETQRLVRLSNAPLLEGAIAAAAAAAGGQNLDAVQRAAENILQAVPKIEAAETAPAPSSDLDRSSKENSVSAEAVVPNALGLHARPALLFVKTAAAFKSRIRLQNLTRQRAPVDAKMPLQVAFGGTARKGDRIRIAAVGPDADQALAALVALVGQGFGEIQAASASAEGSDSAVAGGSVAKPAPPSGRLLGVGVSEGTAVGPAFVYRPDAPAVVFNASAAVFDAQRELGRLRHALAAAADQLAKLQDRVAQEMDPRAGWIFEFQRMLLGDAAFVRQMEDAVLSGGCSSEKAVRTAMGLWKERAWQLDDVMRARVVDLQDVENRLLQLLSGGCQALCIEPEQPSILIAAALSPSEVADLDRTKVIGIATARGAAASHAAILARQRDIPTVMGLGETVLMIPDRTRLALDGGSGRIELDPSPKAAAAFQKRAADLSRFQSEALANAREPAVTLDGKQVAVWANATDPASVREALCRGAEGIGLLRTEFLFLNRGHMPSEEEQYRVYRDIAAAADGKPVVIRTLDVGGDKVLPYLENTVEQNPALGLRSLRLCLAHPEVFQPQLRALLRAAAAGNLKIMFPMVAVEKELAAARDALDQAGRDLAQRGVKTPAAIEVGIMIETPAAAIKARGLAQKVDFLSIGSNDLTQYTLACERGHAALGDLFDAGDAAVLWLVRRTIAAGRAAGVPVALCGEFAAQKDAVPILLGLGLDTFSVAPSRLPLVKQWIRRLNSSTCRAAAEKRLAGRR